MEKRLACQCPVISSCNLATWRVESVSLNTWIPLWPTGWEAWQKILSSLGQGPGLRLCISSVWVCVCVSWVASAVSDSLLLYGPLLFPSDSPLRTPEWVSVPSSRGPSPPRNRTHVSMSPALAGRLFTTSATWEAQGLNQMPLTMWMLSKCLFAEGATRQPQSLKLKVEWLRQESVYKYSLWKLGC